MKADIALGIVFTILSHDNSITAKDIANKYSISIRTVYRYVDYLDLSGIPITTKCGKNGGISILHTFSLKNAFFTNIELITLIQACSAVTNIPLRDNIQSKLLFLLHGKK